MPCGYLTSVDTAALGSQELVLPPFEESLVLAECGHRMAMCVWSQARGDAVLLGGAGWGLQLKAGCRKERGEATIFLCSTVFHSCYLGQTHCSLESTSLQEEAGI